MSSKPRWFSAASDLLGAFFGLLALREFVVHAYKDPVWIVATLIFVCVVGWTISFLDGIPERFSKSSEAVARAVELTAEFKLVPQMQEWLLRAEQSELVVSEFIHDKVLDHLVTGDDAVKCKALVEKARYELILASSSVEGFRFHDPMLAEFQLAMKSTLHCIATGLTLMGEVCQANDASRLNSIEERLFSNSLECLATATTQSKVFEAYSKADAAREAASLEADNLRRSVLKFVLVLFQLAELYTFGYIAAVLLCWERIRRQHLRDRQL